MAAEIPIYVTSLLYALTQVWLHRGDSNHHCHALSQQCNILQAKGAFCTLIICADL